MHLRTELRGPSLYQTVEYNAMVASTLIVMELTIDIHGLSE